MSFLHTLKKEDREILRRVVKKVHFKHYPDQFCTDYEADSDLFGEKCFDMMIIYNCRKYQEQAHQATILRKLFL